MMILRYLYVGTSDTEREVAIWSAMPASSAITCCASGSECIWAAYSVSTGSPAASAGILGTLPLP